MNSSTVDLAPTDTASHHRTVKFDGLEIFYREAGPQEAPAVLLTHGWPSASQKSRNQNPLLSDGYVASPSQGRRIQASRAFAIHGKRVLRHSHSTRNAGTAFDTALLIARRIAANGDVEVRQLTHTLRVKPTELGQILAFDAARQAEGYATAECRNRIARYLLEHYAG
jgi:hypothetical protein